MNEEEINQINAMITYADTMNRIGAKIKRIGIPILRNGIMLGANFYRTYRGRAMLEFNPNYIYQAWTIVWMENVNGEWIFDQFIFREDFMAEHYGEEPVSIQPEVKVPREKYMPIVQIPL